VKILLVTDTYYPTVNGVVTSTNNLYKALKELGHSVRILTLSDSFKEKISDHVYYVRAMGISIYPDVKIKDLFHNKVVDLLIKWKPDIIHTQTEFSTMSIAKHISKELNIPMVHTYHTLWEDYTHLILRGHLITKGFVGIMSKTICDGFDCVITPTKKTKDVLEKYNITPPIEIVPTGIDLTKFEKDVPEDILTELKYLYNITDKKVLLYVGRVSKEKNLDELIQYFSKLIIDDGVFLIVGDGPYLKNIKELVETLNLEKKVIFTGMVKSDEINQYYKLGNVFITASTSETQGLTYIEAMASGLPVVCKKDKAIEELIIDNENGFTFINEEEFIRGVNTILNKDDISEFKKNAKITASKYSIRSFGEGVETVYKKTIANYNPLKKEYDIIDKFQSIGKNILEDINKMIDVFTKY